MNADPRSIFRKGTLWDMIVTAGARALERGAQLPIPTEYEFIEEKGVRFFVRVLSRLGQKDAEREKPENAFLAGSPVNPFLPYEEDLCVTGVSDTHVALLNKFNVVEHHLLIVTREFEDQETLLTVRDFEALWACMSEYHSLGFYNGGEAAGASQSHKHLQVVPLPLAPEGPEIPIAPLLKDMRGEDDSGLLPGFPFIHLFARFPEKISGSPGAAAEKSFGLYAKMLRKLELETPASGVLKKQSSPYCLLIAREWMLLVPRVREFFGSISLNSLAFAGSFFVRNAEQAEVLRKTGPIAALRKVAVPLLTGG
jgi:ATP adenylyltransferase